MKRHLFAFGVAALAFTAAVSSDFGGFAPHLDYGVGDAPHEVAVADFNGDGWLDLATDDANADTVSVLLNNGDGTFGPAVSYPTPDVPLTIKTADLDGDGDADLTVGCGNGAAISVYFNNGDGTFVLHQTYAFDLEVWGVIMAHTMADFDGDGDTDVAIVMLTPNYVVILPNDGSGTFDSPQVIDEISWFSFPTDIEPGDFDSDVDVDLVVIYGSNMLRMLLNNGDATFAAPIDSPIGGHDIVAPPADFNGDGFLDIGLNMTINPGGYISIALGNGDGTFGPVTTYLVNRPSGITTSDFDRDGDIDLAVTSYNTYNTVSVMLGNGDGTFADPLPFATAGNPEGPVAADFNNDSWPDIVTANRNADNVSVLMNLTDYSLGDLDCDGAINALDINPFVKVLTGNLEAYYQQNPGCNHLNADINCDGAINALDINPFVRCLTSECPPCR